MVRLQSGIYGMGVSNYTGLARGELFESCCSFKCVFAGASGIQSCFADLMANWSAIC